MFFWNFIRFSIKCGKIVLLCNCILNVSFLFIFVVYLHIWAHTYLRCIVQISGTPRRTPRPTLHPGDHQNNHNLDDVSNVCVGTFDLWPSVQGIHHWEIEGGLDSGIR